MATASHDDLERRLQRLEDRAAIQELLARYAMACDLRDFDALIDTFTDDGIFHSVIGATRGRDELRAYYEDRFSRYGPTFHVPHSLVLEELVDDHARGRVQAHSEIMMDEGLFVSGHVYVDEYERTSDGAWRFSSRECQFLYGIPAADLGTMDWRDRRRRWPGAEPMKADLPEGSPTWRAFASASGVGAVPNANQ